MAYAATRGGVRRPTDPVRIAVAAKEKATALAAELGQAVGDPIDITEQGGRWQTSYAWWGARRSARSSNVSVYADEGGGPLGESTLAPGQIGVHASVSVTFELISAERK